MPNSFSFKLSGLNEFIELECPGFSTLMSLVPSFVCHIGKLFIITIKKLHLLFFYLIWHYVTLYVMLTNVLWNGDTGNKNNLSLCCFLVQFLRTVFFPFWVPTPLPQIFIFNPFLNWNRVHAKAKNGSFTLCLHISLCCINNASKSERHKSHIATGWQNKEPDTRGWASVLEGVKAELGKSPHNSSRKISYYERRGSESACQWCCTEKRDCTMPFLIPGVGENSG